MPFTVVREEIAQQQACAAASDTASDQRVSGQSLHEAIACARELLQRDPEAEVSVVLPEDAARAGTERFRDLARYLDSFDASYASYAGAQFHPNAAPSGYAAQSYAASEPCASMPAPSAAPAPKASKKRVSSHSLLGGLFSRPDRKARRDEDVAACGSAPTAAPMPAAAPAAAAPAAVAAPSAAPASAASAAAPESLRDLLDSLDAPFSTTLLTIIDSRGLTDAEVYRRANLSRQHFSKIRSNPAYQPTKKTVLALAVALELNLEETRDLLARAGFALSRASRFDMIVEWFIAQGNYDIFEINEALFSFDQPILG